MNLKNEDKDWLVAIMTDKINHLDSSPSTRKALDKLDSRMITMEEHIRTKVSWKQFAWITAILIAFMTAMLSAIWVQVRTNGDLAQTTRSEVSYMKGILNNSIIYE